MKYRLFEESLVLGMAILFLGTSVLPGISGNIGIMKDGNSYSAEQMHSSIPDNGVLDVQYIYNITAALSNIIFTEYNETNGDIAKGRAFGTKGEHRAAEILYENMTKLGLYTTMEQIKNTRKYPELTHKTEVLDYKLILTNKSSSHNETVDCFIAPVQNQLDCNFSFKGLRVKHSPKLSCPLAHNHALAGEKEDYVFIKEDDSRFHPDPFVDPIRSLLTQFFGPFGVPVRLWERLKNRIEKAVYDSYPNCRGLIVYDFNDHTHDMRLNDLPFPILFINGTIGRIIVNDFKNFTVDDYLDQRYNESVISYNVIGQLNGTDPTKTVIVDCLYDSWWCQGTADSAIGMAMVLGIAKYFHDHNITPKYTVKFIAFAGEEAGGIRGATYYEAVHRDEHIIYVIDLNQLGFIQEEPKLTLNIITNKRAFLREIWKIVERTDYVKRMGNTVDIDKWWYPLGHVSDDYPFATKRPLCKTVCFAKDTGWKLHHRDGLGHTAGDVLDYFNWTDVSATGEIVLNVTKYLTVDNPQDQFTTA